VTDDVEPRDGKWRPEYTDASGRQADPATLVDTILSELESRGFDVDADSYRETLKNLDWSNRGDRNAVRERFQDNGDYQEPHLPGFGPNGRGRTAKPTCGDPHPFICDCCGRNVNFGETCGQSCCSRCARVWNRDLAAAKAAKMHRLRVEKQAQTPGQGKDGEWQKFHHLSISPPLGWYRDLAAAGLTLQEAQDVTQDVVKDILAELRAQGVVVRHSFRGADDRGDLKDEYDDRGEWKNRLYSEREWYGDVRDELAWKPHFHAVVVADRVHVTNEPDDPDARPNLSTVVENETGWVIHRIEGRDGKKSIPNDGAMARVLTYTLSHADIMMNQGPQDRNNSQVWTVGSFHGEAVQHGDTFVPTDADKEWAASAVRDAAEQVLGLQSATTVCSEPIPGVDEPDELARRIQEEIWGDDADRVPADIVLDHLARGNIGVQVSTTDGSGGDVTVTDAFGAPVGDGFEDVPSAGSSRVRDPGAGAGDTPAAVDALQEDGADVLDDVADADLRSTSSTSDGDDECGGQMIPLGEARQRGLLDDPEWCKQAPRVDEAREADREWPDDLDTWNYEGLGDSGPPVPS